MADGGGVSGIPPLEMQPPEHEGLRGSQQRQKGSVVLQYAIALALSGIVIGIIAAVFFAARSNQAHDSVIEQTELQKLGLRGPGSPSTPEGDFQKSGQRIMIDGTFCPVVFCNDTLLCHQKPERCKTVEMSRGEMMSALTPHELVDLANDGAFTFLDPTRRRIVQHVVVTVVVQEEIKFLIELIPDLKNDEEMVNKFNGLVDNVYTTQITNHSIKNFPLLCDDCDYQLTVLKFAASKPYVMFERHQSGFTQAAAIAADIASVFSSWDGVDNKGRYKRPDLVISFGTSGARVSSNGKSCSLLEEGQTDVGDVFLSNSNFFLPRLRLSKNKEKFFFGLWGGGSIKSDGLRSKLRSRIHADIQLHFGPASSSIAYAITPIEQEIFRTIGSVINDMEAAPEAQVFNQEQINFLKVAVVSNGIYFEYPSATAAGNMAKEHCSYDGKTFSGPEGQMAEYEYNIEKVMRSATQTQSAILSTIAGHTIEQLATLSE